MEKTSGVQTSFASVSEDSEGRVVGARAAGDGIICGMIVRARTAWQLGDMAIRRSGRRVLGSDGPHQGTIDWTRMTRSSSVRRQPQGPEAAAASAPCCQFPTGPASAAFSSAFSWSAMTSNRAREIAPGSGAQ